MYKGMQAFRSVEFHSKESDILKANGGTASTKIENSKVPLNQPGARAGIRRKWSATGATLSNRATQQGVIGFIGALRLFEDLSPADCSAIISRACVKRFLPHHIIFSEGDAVEHVTLLLSGCVKITQQGLRGNKAIIRLIGIGEVVGTFGMWSDCKYGSTSQAIQSCTALVWDAATFDVLLDRFVTFQRNMIRALEECVQKMEQRFREVSTENAGSRLSSELIRSSKHFACADNEPLRIRLSRAELAELTGTNVQTVSSHLHRWQELGIVSLGREAVEIRNVDALACSTRENLQFSQGSRL